MTWRRGRWSTFHRFYASRIVRSLCTPIHVETPPPFTWVVVAMGWGFEGGRSAPNRVQSSPRAMEATVHAAGSLRSSLGTRVPGHSSGLSPPSRAASGQVGRPAASPEVLQHARDEGGW